MMCVVSMISDGYLGNTFPQWPKMTVYPSQITEYVSKRDFDKLQAEVQELKKLLLAAKEYDEKTGQPDCEQEEKVDLIKKIAKLVGVDMEEVFGQ